MRVTVRWIALLALLALLVLYATTLLMVRPAGAEGPSPDGRRSGSQGTQQRTYQKDKRAARVLDQILLPPGSTVIRVRDRTRVYAVSSSSAEVLAFFRDQLPMLGWSERSVAQEARQSSGLPKSTIGRTDGAAGNGVSTGGPEVTNRGPDEGGVAGGATRNIAAVNRGRFSRPDARLDIVVRSTRNGNAKTNSNVENALDQSTYRLAVHVR